MSFALPEYLTRNTRFDDCPPGHRFGLYFDGWEADWRKPTNKTPAYSKAADSFPSHARAALAALCARQRSLASALGETVLTYPARLSAPLATGLGNEHPLENGFAFLNPHGLPYLAGSGVKGVIRRAAEELASGEWGANEGWAKDTIRILFGPGEDDPDRDTHARRGALMFWDLFFKPANDKNALLAVEIMTPHHSGYLQGNGTPHANESPNPIPFLAIAAGCECTLHVQCNPSLIPADATSLRESWRSLVEAAIVLAGEWIGFGAKTSVGYGRLEQDPSERARREEAKEQARKLAESKAAELAAEQLPPDERLLAMLDRKLAELPKDPREGKPIIQATSGAYWQPVLDLAESQADSLTTLDPGTREKLAVDIKRRLTAHFKIEGKAEKAMKQLLATVRNG